MTALYYIASAAICYVIGSVPTAYVLVKMLKGIDIRTVGSGNVGATNAGRALGGWAFAVVLILDALKGYLPLFVISYLIKSYSLPVNLLLVGAFAVIAGHTYSVFLGFKGGKGVATGLGVCLALVPVPVLIALGVFIVVFGITRMVSAGSVCAAIALGVAVTLLSDWLPLIGLMWVMALFVVYKHIPNIKRIIAGTESKVKFGK